MITLLTILTDSIERHQTSTLVIADIFWYGKGKVEQPVAHGIGSLIERARTILIYKGFPCRCLIVLSAYDDLFGILNHRRHHTIEG